jgi:hypothetical protein
MPDPRLFPTTVEGALAHVAEEAGEVVQECCKALRFGIYNYHPSAPHETNIDRIRREVRNLNDAMARLEGKVKQQEPKP